MQELEIRCCLSLLDLPGAGASSVARLLVAAGSALSALQLSRHRLDALRLRPETLAALAALHGRPSVASQRRCDWLLQHDAAVLTVLDPDYPPLLQQIPEPPPVLFVRGSLHSLRAAQIAIVGSRHPTASGSETALRIARELCDAGLAVTSGLAMGIDTASHRGALAANGTTIAVMGTGLDTIYPARNRGLAQDILGQGGALLSEFVPGTRPEPWNFPRRNRIISGLSLGVLVVEAALPSGSLLTAQCAAEHGREVMAVPGSVRSPVSKGCHELLRHGAALVESADDVLFALGDRFAPKQSRVPPNRMPPETGSLALNAEERRVWEATGFEETPADLIVQRSGLPAAIVSATLTRLELRGLLISAAGGYLRQV
jgi:DNA processing protein